MLRVDTYRCHTSQPLGCNRMGCLVVTEAKRVPESVFSRVFSFLCSGSSVLTDIAERLNNQAVRR